jgi:hypothetical protein
VLAPPPFGAASGEVDAEVSSPDEVLSYWFPEGIDATPIRTRAGARWSGGWAEAPASLLFEATVAPDAQSSGIPATPSRRPLLDQGGLRRGG